VGGWRLLGQPRARRLGGAAADGETRTRSLRRRNAYHQQQELWQALLTEIARHQIEWVKVAGHAGVELNERVDQIACAERDRHVRRTTA
jgi:ribonuclease HI